MLNLLLFTLTLLAVAGIVFVIEENKRRQLDRLYAGQPEMRRDAEHASVDRSKRVSRFVILPIALTFMMVCILLILFLPKPSP